MQIVILLIFLTLVLYLAVIEFSSGLKGKRSKCIKARSVYGMSLTSFK